MPSLKTEANMIEVEAIRRAAHNPLPFSDLASSMPPAQLRDLRLMLARRYDRLVEKYNLDAPEMLEERIRNQYDGA